MKRLSNPSPNAVRAVVLCAAVLLAAIPLSAQDAEARRLEDARRSYARAVELTLERFVRVFNDLDWEPFRAHFADDATVFFPLRSAPLRADGRAELEAVFGEFFRSIRSSSSGPPYLTIEPRDLRIQMLGGAAIATFHLGDDDESAIGRRTLVLRRDGDGVWRIVHLHGSSAPRAARPGVDTVRVAPPTGEQEIDRASILAALERARPGDVIQFGPGTYLVGELLPIETPQLTMLGHANGTTLRGCEPETNKQLERDRQAARDDLQARLLIMRRCGVFEMTGGHGTVRGLTFEHSWMGLALGAASTIESRMTEGGYLVENNVFRNSGNGVRTGVLSSAPTVIRGNRFMNVFHVLSGAGAGLHVVDNDISVPEPDPVALPDGPGFAIGIDDGAEGCVIEGNRIEGHRAGIVLFGVPGRPTRRNVIRDNTITGTVFPVRLWADQEDGDPIQIEDNLIERNRITGGVVGIALNRASDNRILDNTITGITVRDPSPGEANGAGLWLSPGSDGNEIAANIFEDIASHAVVIEGDSNRVELRSTSDRVRDLGSGNRVSGPGSSTEGVKRMRTRRNPWRAQSPPAVPPGRHRAGRAVRSASQPESRPDARRPEPIRAASRRTAPRSSRHHHARRPSGGGRIVDAVRCFPHE